MRFSFLLTLLLPLVLAAETFEESLFLRRIAEFWQEGEYQLVKSQIEEFTEEYPESEFSDPLSAALGDLFLREKNFNGALKAYSQVQSEEFKERIFLNRLECLYELQWHATLADECESYLQTKGNHQQPVTYFLAIALYQQCLNASQNPETLLHLAKRAEPHFKNLFEQRASQEIAQGYAHICSILGDFSKAAQIYFDLAKAQPEEAEELLFLAAFAQSKCEREKAAETFAQIEAMGAKKAKEAAYNHLVLSFELERYDELIQNKEKILSLLSPEKAPLAHLFFGRSYLNLKEYKEAMGEFQTYLQEPHSSSETIRAALTHLLEASFREKDLTAFDEALEKMAQINPEDPELAKAHFSRAQILKQDQKLDSAKMELEQILSRFPQSPQKSLALFELTHIDYQNKNWKACRERAAHFLEQFPRHELAPFAWRYLLSALEELGLKGEFAAELDRFLTSDFLTDSERAEWRFHLAKTHYELKNFESCIELLQNATEPNAYLLLALCHRDGLADLEQFCKWGEKALEGKATLIEEKPLHLALFNAYLELSSLEKGADHLFAVLEQNGQLEEENLLWLADFYAQRSGENPLFAKRAAAILEKILASNQTPEVICKLARLYSALNQTDLQIALLEKFGSSEKEAQLLLAEGYARKGKSDQAIELFDSILSSSPTLRTPTAASASLQAIRLKMQREPSDRAQLAAELKNLVLQKTFANEPIHLEAALDYIDLQSKSTEKRLELLEKTKADFESTADLLSQDYQAARNRFPEKNRIYEGYMKWIDAEICRAQSALTSDSQLQKQLQAKAKDLLLQIIDEPLPPSLNERARQKLDE